MTSQNTKKTLLGLTLDELKDVCSEVGLRPFSAGQIARWLYEKRVCDIEEMTDLPKQGRAKLAETYTVGRCNPLREAVSADGTRKYLFEGVGDSPVEAVFIPDKERATLCISSQAGCKMNCAFCATGRGGFHGSLPASSIINQVLSVPGSDELTNIVFMGMGEPADNADEVIKTIDIMTAKWGLAWSPRRITVSSIGKIDGLRRILNETKVHIAISLHNPFPSRRREIMPVEGAWSILEVIDLLRGYDFSHQRRLSFEYIMWDGVNDDVRHATALSRMLRGLDCRVNLIRYHSLDPSEPLRPAKEATMVAFRDRLNANGITATIRASRGEDIDAACGMLAGKEKKENS